MAERESGNSPQQELVVAEWLNPETNTIYPDDLVIMMRQYRNNMLIIDVRHRTWFHNEQIRTDVLMLNIEQYTLLRCHNPSDFTMLLSLVTRSQLDSLTSLQFIALIDAAFDLRDAQQIETWCSILHHLKQILPPNCQSALLKVLVGGWVHFEILFPDMVRSAMRARIRTRGEIDDQYAAHDDDDDDDDDDIDDDIDDDDDDDDDDENYENDENDENYDDGDDLESDDDYDYHNRNNSRRSNNRYDHYDDDYDSDSDDPYNPGPNLRRGVYADQRMAMPRFLMHRPFPAANFPLRRIRDSSSRGRSRSPLPCWCLRSALRTCLLPPPEAKSPVMARRCIFPGLINEQESCFINSIIFCLYSTVELRNYIVHHWDRLASFDHEIMREFCKLIYEMRDRSIISITPKSFLTAFSHRYWMVNDSHLRTAYEAYTCLLSSLHEGFQQQGLVLNSSSGARKGMTTIIKELFDCEIVQRTIYQCCGAVEVGSPQPYDSLTIDVPQLTNVYTLENCLKIFLNTLFSDGGSGSVTCPRCNQSKAHLICQARISSLPHILVIRLFLNRYRTSVVHPYENSSISIEDPLYVPLDENGVERTVSYKLYAMVEYIREGSSRHYVSVCRDSQTGDWFYLDGHEFREINREYKPKNPYMLFYEKCHSEA
ncbi:Ubiquitin carboxyl-terminal hydrolase 4 [Trichinella papuae]|uniref:Ubiquitin carboxyl-terminal hydrolase 4 n=1 Tax=Trichinella papuae TaxID=268474 RepID=A0A0V1MRN5_9BILA|nr:Ubiquitin carboxyl-terminal hydrolase 4 [Trichinella papuae]